MARPRRTQAGGSKMFEFVAVLVLLGGLSMVVLEYMLHYIEAAEKSAMETNILYLRSALRMRLAEVIVDNDADEIVSLISGNPMDWVPDKPSNYVGPFHDPQPGFIEPGKWYFDTKSHELVYVVKHGREFVPDKNGFKRARFRVYAPSVEKALKENRQILVRDIVRETALVVAVPYQWEFK